MDIYEAYLVRKIAMLTSDPPAPPEDIAALPTIVAGEFILAALAKLTEEIKAKKQ